MNQYTEKDIIEIVTRVINAEKPPISKIESAKFLVEASARHVHLTQADIDALFGGGHKLTAKKDLSQPGQFACEERVKIVTAKGQLEGVAVLGPTRSKTQVELSATDCRTLGLNAPLRLSGDLEDAVDVILVGPCGSVNARNSAIIAQRHIHMTNADAHKFGVQDGQKVSVKVEGARPVTFDDVIIRVTEKSKLAMHLDLDEANAAMIGASGKGCIIERGEVVENFKKSEPAPRFGKLITEECARKLLPNLSGFIKVPAGTILTPAARDVFTNNHIRIE